MWKVICFIGTIFLGNIIHPGWCQNCRDKAWEKVSGMRPESINSSEILHSGMDSQGIVSTCFRKCKSTNCSAFIIDLKRSGCFSIVPNSEEFVPEANITFYHIICLKVPPICSHSRLWQVERTLGAILIDTSTEWMPQIMTRRQCYEKCIEEGDRCKSAQFRTSHDLWIGDSRGKCALSTVERGIRPQAYRASMYRDEYLQNQCHNISTNDYCSYAEFRNMTIPYSDVKLQGLDAKQCEERCNLGSDGFVCRGYTILNKTTCLLHAEDTISAGVSSLVNQANAIYKEREPCLDLKVKCNDSSMKLELTTIEPFWGRIYVNGWGETCGTHGNGRNSTTLILPLPKKEDLSSNRNINCGLIPAFSVDRNNRTHTMVWSTIVIQFNPIIQRLGDQAIRVGCRLGEGELPEPRNVTVQSSISFLDPNAGIPTITSIKNASSEAPIITMRILDNDMKDATYTRVGDKLMLKIQITPANGIYDIAAGHLVASSANGESSYLLLDEAGCPTNPRTFPALDKDPRDNRSLIARFNAFKFPNSLAICGNNSISYGKKRRSLQTEPTIANVTEITQTPTNNSVDELSLQLFLIVQDQYNTADPLLSKETKPPDTLLITAGQTLDNLLCMDAGLVLGLLLFWLVIQILLLIACLLSVMKYRKIAKQAEEDRAEILTRHFYGIHGGNFEIGRRVRWADHNSSSIS
ncbi:uncharacterized protein LOC105704404 isoform X2 [Orussus abietinus]|uniref:uncharacterized protein LOC105704404 isoform X2 n=1 Tax=Orussus abietinus TaxID=222816 RepID=UPI000C716172|nr:uncharacterized protein LOC105704404 isoform X2 [Orussus abietinus]